MKIKLKLFSGLMEYLPARTDGNVLEVSVPGSTTPHMLIDQYKVPREAAQVVMKNGEFLPLEERDIALRDGDVIAIWPSIQGG